MSVLSCLRVDVGLSATGMGIHSSALLPSSLNKTDDTDEMTLTPSTIAIIVSGCIALFAYKKTKERMPLPPGPPHKLISGNLHQLQRTEPWEGYMKWGAIYGPILHFRVFTRRIIVLNSSKAVQDLLESRSNIYSDRPVMWMYTELVGRKWAIFNISSLHPWFRKYRSLFRTALYANDMVDRYQEVQERCSVTLLELLKNEPENFISHARRNAGSAILEVAYGWSVQDENDYLLSLMKEAFTLQGELTRPGAWLVDIFPWLRFIPSWFPGGGFHIKAREYREKMDPVDRFAHAWVKNQMASGIYNPSFTSTQLQLYSEREGGLSQEDEDVIRWTAAGLYAGGADTTVSAMTTFFLVMTLHSDVQKRAQEEIDRVVGKDRLPHVKDRGELPYVEAIIKEILRWAPVVPLGLLRRVTQEDDYMGLRIPEGATVLANIWAIMRDPDLYSDPSSFNPNRFLGKQSEPDPRKFAFGFGRRICPGAQFAEDSLFMNISRILATFEVRRAVGIDGAEIETPVEFTSGITRHPKPFPCQIVLRDGSAGARLLSES
ncbi:hypothetical protein V5O48_000918 [Marasmius crinis-equi]|uniref:Cytochrome P450 n=1 Tax=Marasmius crinis-equi TaxID=585013 RepID=A0ABR3G0E1_9AGAR